MVAARKLPEGASLEEEVSTCRHHWLIDAAGGRLSKGVCRQCGAQRSFTNYLEGSAWGPSEPAAAEKERLPALVGVTTDDTINEE